MITHGTDTMTVTARALAPVADKTIVLTGAFAPARFSASDAAFNLGMAFATAQLAAPGIFIAINGSVFPLTASRRIASKVALYSYRELKSSGRLLLDQKSPTKRSTQPHEVKIRRRTQSSRCQ